MDIFKGLELIIQTILNGGKFSKEYQVWLEEDDERELLPDDSIATSLGYIATRVINDIGIAKWWIHDKDIVEGYNSTILLCNGNVLHVQSIDIEGIDVDS